jgi:phospholipase C
MALADIEHFVIVMMENRSFDHMLGYLSLPGPDALAVDGLTGPECFSNPAPDGQLVKSYTLTADVMVNPDLPHNWNDVDAQINAPGGPMQGFVTTYAQPKSQGHPVLTDPAVWRQPMSCHDRTTVPTYDFLARNFAVCDNWHAALPAGTQPNRLMFLSGYSGIYDNGATALPHQSYVYDWLSNKGVNWRLYHAGVVPFVALDPTWRAAVLATDPRIKPYDNGDTLSFDLDWTSGAAPPVIFIEPALQDDPFVDADKVCDDHPVSGVSAGQAFIASVYNTLVSSPDRWSKTLLIITYDEHGGFFDHAPPITLTHPTVCADKSFSTNGVRVPALLVSPWLDPARPCHLKLDHTSVLQLLADRFAPNAAGVGEYSADVTARQVDLDPLRTFIDQGLASPRDFTTPIPVAEAAPDGPFEPDETRAMQRPTPEATAMRQGFLQAGLELGLKPVR